ncbi:peptidase C14 caspase catalytic subunit p20 [Methylobacterium sp. 4-46]|uniref:caspase family protein n=1 Tax=unclassified Methylobacterium TaxID=2615210 RepID=UPI000152DF5A|nr:MULTISPECIES: caspase family protein [Methylobacterium]ACA16115.1 peptidase C14 caspase catalytic subunit p20 [Methylobacterium sp. 4-46]WFT81824.1 caspase family protein [Methylobacterium nodulans]
MTGSVGRALLILLTLCLSAAAARAERRLAFVVGVNAYANLPQGMQLERAVRDAETVADALQSLDFRVARLTREATLTGFLTAFGAFTREVEPGDTVLFYFAGHGVALDGVNYLIPADIPSLAAGGEGVVRKLALAEADIIQDIQSRGARVTILVIDACRDNPFPKAGSRTLGAPRGLAFKEPPQGVFSLYSAGAGQQALDRLPGSDPSPNSVFTRVFAAELRKPGTSLVDLGETVREEVAALARRANHDQIPAVYNQVLGARRIMLAGARAEPPAPAAPRADEIAWRFLKTSTDPEALRSFVAQFGDSPLRAEAQARLAEIETSRRQTVAALPRPTLRRVGDEALCDELAAVSDGRERAPGLRGVPLDKIDARRAVEACRAATRAAPDNPRYAVQLGRALHADKQYGDAAAWYRRAADQGSAQALNNLATLTLEGLGGLERSPDEALRLFHRAAERGSVAAMRNLGNLYRTGRQGVAKDSAEAVRWYRAAVEREDAAAMVELGVMTARGEGVPKDEAEAGRLYARAERLGNAAAQNNLGLFLLHGKGGFAKDEAEAARLFRRAAEAGNAHAMAHLGWMTKLGKGGLAKDDVEAVRLYRRSAEAGNSLGMAYLAAMYREGRGGLPEDAREARRLYERAAEEGSAVGRAGLAFLHERGLGGLPRNEAEALRLYRLAAEENNGVAIDHLGQFHRDGKGGLRPDPQAAMAQFRRAADLGFAPAMAHLGALYEKRRNAAEALAWYRRAADLDDPLGLYLLGQAHETGLGMPRNRGEALRLYGRAAELGHAGAAAALRRLGRRV